MQALLDVILPVFVLIGFGYLAVWQNWFSDSGVDALMRFTQWFAIPCLLFRAISTLDLGANFNFPLLFSFYFGASVSFAIGIAISRFAFKRNWTDAIAIGFVCLFSNSVLLGLPITERAFGPDALSGNYAIVALHAPFCYMLGVTAMEIAKSGGGDVLTTTRRVFRSMFRNALVIGIGLGFFVNIGSIPLPGVLIDAIDMMTLAAIPAALFGLGGVLYRYRPEGDLRLILVVTGVSLVVHPTLSFATATAVGLETSAFRSVVLTATMAPGINTYLFANMYGAARRVAASSVLIGTVCSILSIWLWLFVLP